MIKERALTGIKPTGSPHIGNLLGAIKPALDIANSYQALYFIADYHALTTVRDKALMKSQIHEVAATWLAAGLNPEEVIFYRQSDIPEVFELSWILSCFSPKGLMNRAHSYKDMTSKNEAAGADLDKGIHMGVYNYPILMAADILLYSAHKVPVGQDQKQHLEIARDIAQAFNQQYGEILVLPEPMINESVKTIPGIDGRKMSKSYDNVIPLYQTPKKLKKRINQIVTDSKGVEEPKDPETCNLFAIYKYFASEAQTSEMAAAYKKGGLGYGHIKGELFDLVDAFVAPGREVYEHHMNHLDELDKILQLGAEKARTIARPKLAEVRKAIGME
ncbi:MAG: tryptophan--tRNA ligase [SAR324 cluster bacterium]|nr:tryptophan--tRNA ligase [SAR324 cluster bacterium]